MSQSEPKPLGRRQLDRVVAARENENLELTEWEETFLRSLQGQLTRFEDRELSEKQLSVLEKIEGYIKDGRPQR